MATEQQIEGTRNGSRLSSDEISFGSMLATLRREKKRVLLPVFCAALCATAAAFLIPPQYTAEAVILTPQQAQPSLSAMAQLSGGGAGLAGLSLLSGFGLRNPSDLYVGILQSRTIIDAIIVKFNLKAVYDVEGFYGARKHLVRNTSIKAGKDTLIHIEVSDRNARRAADLANAYVSELASQNSTVALTEASQRRLFFEQQLVKEKDLLAKAEVDLRDTQRLTGLVVPTGQAEAMMRSISQLHAEILSRQAQLAGLKTYVADENPRLRRLTREIGALQSDLANLENGAHVAGTPEVPVGELPQAGLDYIRRLREVKYHESLFEGLSKQYEAARLDEAKAAPLVQVIDRAVTPEKKSWPPRAWMIAGSTLLAAIATAVWIIAKEETPA
jgi:tyrosine-protein kinase Etk/Wzc